MYLKLYKINGRINTMNTYNKKVCLLSERNIQEKYESEVFIEL